jgi:hypothetical protein
MGAVNPGERKRTLFATKVMNKPARVVYTNDISSRSALIIAAVFMLANLAWFVSVSEMARNPVVHCTYHSSQVTCTPAG